MATTPRPALTPTQLEDYVQRLGVDPRGAALDLAGLTEIHLAHLERIPFENLDIVFGQGVPHDQMLAVAKIVDGGAAGARGGWCFEVNGALALLLEAVGYEVRLLGAAVLLDGPSQVIEHLLLEVQSPLLPPHLVDVGFGDSFDLPLRLNTAGIQDGGSGEYELIPSPQGTTLARHQGGSLRALLRFKRVAHDFADFAPTSRSMQTEPASKWATHPFAMRRLRNDERDGPATTGHSQRVQLTSSQVKIERRGVVDEQPLDRQQWAEALMTWFDIAPPGPWPVST